MENSGSDTSRSVLPRTPRTTQAMRRLGILLEELQPKAIHEFYIPGDLPEKQMLRFRHSELRRQEKINSVLAERARILDERFDGISVGGASTAASVSSQCLDDLASKEAKRITNFIHSQLRRKAYAERVFLERLEKKEALRAKLEKVEKRVEQADAIREHKASELREISETRSHVRDQLLSLERERRESRLEDLKTKQAQQTASVEQFLKQKDETQSAISELWEAKLRQITVRASEHQANLKRKGQEVLSKRREQTRKVIERKTKNIRLQQLKGEEATLRLIDALDRKRQYERRSAEKREQIGALINQDLEKAHLIELTREQMIRERKHVLSLRSKDSVSIEPAPLPGPADYDGPHTSLTETPGGFISVVKPKLTIPGTVDFETAKEVPGPGYYSWGDMVERSTTIPWNTSKKTTFVDDENKARLDLPGPADYDIPSPRNNSGVQLKRDIVSKDWLNHEADAPPGPGTYTVDDFTRNEAIRKKFDGGGFYLKRLTELAPVLEEQDFSSPHQPVVLDI